MFLIIHGDDQVKSRAELQKAITAMKQQQISEIVQLSGSLITLNSIIQNLESGSFFGMNHRLLILEDLHKLKSKTDLAAITDYLAKHDFTDNSLLIWESKELTATQLKKFPQAKIMAIKLSAVIFKLTDALIPGQQLTEILPLFYKACEADSAELVLIMLARQIKSMIHSFDSEYTLPPWQKVKIEKAAKGFGMEKLIMMHNALCIIDVRNKTGELSSDLESELAFWLTKLYS